MNEKLLQDYFEQLAAATADRKPPLGHEDRFFKRLHRRTLHTRRLILQRYAAVALLLFGMGSFIYFIQSPTPEDILAFQKTETYLQTVVTTQLEILQKLEHPNSNKIIEDTKIQIARMQKDYQDLYSIWESRPNQPQLVHALIENLKTQIELLTELQSKITQLKSQNITYEKL